VSAPQQGRFTAALRRWLDAGGERVGEIAIRPDGRGGYRLTHHAQADAPPGTLTLFHQPGEARRLAMDDDAQAYRPLKTAANLRHGWCLEVADAEALRQALDLFYPALFALWLAREEGRLAVVPLRETLERQSGLYAVTRKVTDAGAQAAIARCCRDARARCLRTILWEIGPGQPVPAPDGESPGLPLLCPEACNLLVAAIREEVKAHPPQAL